MEGLVMLLLALELVFSMLLQAWNHQYIRYRINVRLTGEIDGPGKSVNGVMVAILAQTSSDLLVINVSQSPPAFGA